MNYNHYLRHLTLQPTANGGQGSGNQGGGGGGGRIAVWYETTPEQVAAKLANPASITVSTNYSAFAGIYAVSNGIGPVVPPDERAAYPGTCYFLTMPKAGSVFIFY